MVPVRSVTSFRDNTMKTLLLLFFVPWFSANANGSCTYNGRTYSDGKTFPAVDGFDTCKCLHGAVACTEGVATRDAGSCTYDGHTYSDGEVFRAVDGVDMCRCLHGAVACTEAVVDDDSCTYGDHTYSDGEVFRALDGIDWCKCMHGVVACTEGVATRDADSCTYDGHTYSDGAMFRAVDGVDMCRCLHGAVACTEAVVDDGSCTYNGHTYSDGKTFPAVDGFDTCKCLHGAVACTEGVATMDAGDIMTGATCEAGFAYSTGTPDLVFGFCEGSCTYNGHTYSDGKTFPAVDGFDTCKCLHGAVACTEGVAIRDAGSCTYDGHTYSDGEVFRAVDGVDMCRCLHGAVACTEAVMDDGSCTYNGHKYSDGKTFPAVDGFDTCKCLHGAVACTEGVVDDGSCTYNGHKYSDGKTFPAVDGFDTCKCLHGAVACTEAVATRNAEDEKRDIMTGATCGAGHSHSSGTPDLTFGFYEGADHQTDTCMYNGTAHMVGDSFPSTDGCNTCGCGQGGLMFCTIMLCVPPTQAIAVTCMYDGTARVVGESFPAVDGCNTCGCSNKGQVFCTQMLCLNPVKATCTYDGNIFLDGRTFSSVDGCNTCTCKAGMTTCTKDVCEGNLPYVNGAACTYDGSVYSSGQSFPSRDGCNRCSCFNSRVMCTEKACAPGYTTPDPSHCVVSGVNHVPGDAWLASDGCNHCFCSNGGVVGCTEMFCVVGRDLRAAAEGTCKYNNVTHGVGENFPSTDGCNQCFCDMPGAVACTELFCWTPHHHHHQREDVSVGETCEYSNTVYKLHEEFPSTDGCNQCICGSGGAIACTKMYCNPQHQHGARDVHSCEYNKVMYSVGDTFPSMDGCNQCQCERGGSIPCTEMACMPVQHHHHNGKHTPVPTMTPPPTTTSDLSQQLGGGGCHYHGHVYWAGDTWNARDGCNTCYCSAHGGPLCTDSTCREKKSADTALPDVTGSGCSYYGKAHHTDDSFPDVDGCNTCFCADNGDVMCTKMWHCTFHTLPGEGATGNHHQGVN